MFLHLPQSRLNPHVLLGDTLWLLLLLLAAALLVVGLVPSVR